MPLTPDLTSAVRAAAHRIAASHYGEIRDRLVAELEAARLAGATEAELLTILADCVRAARAPARDPSQ